VCACCNDSPASAGYVQVATAIRGAIILAKMSVIPVRRGYWGNKIGKVRDPWARGKGGGRERQAQAIKGYVSTSRHLEEVKVLLEEVT
jgi:hypothetical protein